MIPFICKSIRGKSIETKDWMFSGAKMGKCRLMTWAWNFFRNKDMF